MSAALKSVSNSTSSPLAVLTPIEIVTRMPPERIAWTALRSRSAISVRATAADAGEHDEELLAAEAVDELERAQLLAHLVGDVAQHRVAAVVAVAVVDVLEAVDVAHEQAHGALREPRLLGDLAKARQQRAAVEQLGERVEHGGAAVVELGRLDRPDDRDDAHEQRERRRSRARGRSPPASGRAPKVAARIATAVSAIPAITTCGRKRAAAVSTGRISHGSAALRRAAVQRDAEREHGERDEDRRGAHALRARDALDQQVHADEREPRRARAARGRAIPPRHRDEERDAERGEAHEAQRAHALVRVDDASSIELGRAQPGTPSSDQGSLHIRCAVASRSESEGANTLDARPPRALKRVV